MGSSQMTDAGRLFFDVVGESFGVIGKPWLGRGTRGAQLDSEISDRGCARNGFVEKEREGRDLAR